MSGKSGNQRQGTFERVSLGELVGSSPAFAEEVRRSRDVLEGGALVRRMREMADGGAGISQEELAQRLGLSQARISAIEKGGGTQGPTYGLLKRVARACGLDFEPAIRPHEMGSVTREQAELPSRKIAEVHVQELVAAQRRGLEAEARARAEQEARRRAEEEAAARRQAVAEAKGQSGAHVAEPAADVQVALCDLETDGNGEVVIYNDAGFRSLAIETDAAVVASGQSGAHVTEAGEDVSGFRFVTFDNGVTLYYQEVLDLDLVTQATASSARSSREAHDARNRRTSTTSSKLDTVRYRVS